MFRMKMGLLPLVYGKERLNSQNVRILRDFLKEREGHRGESLMEVAVEEEKKEGRIGYIAIAKGKNTY